MDKLKLTMSIPHDKWIYVPRGVYATLCMQMEMFVSKDFPFYIVLSLL